MQSKYIIGYKYQNCQGLDVEVVEYRGRKDIDVKFTLDGAIKTTTGSYIKKLLPLHPTFGKPFIGQQFGCHDGDIVEVIEVISGTHVLAKWLSDGSVCKKSVSSLKEGFNRHPTKNKPNPGDIFKTNKWGNVTVLKFNSAIDVDIKFEDGVEYKAPMSRLLSGNIRHPNCEFNKGLVFKTKSGWSGEVVEYRDAHNVLVRWQDGSESLESSGDIRLGAIKPAMQPSVEGIGYLGTGKYVNGLHLSGEKPPEKIYAYWVRMFSRCYNPSELNKSKNMSYRNIHVNKNWHNFHNFAEWALRQYNTKNYDFELDKDLLCKGVKEYNENNCCFIPAEINLFLMQQDRGKFYRGVNVIEPKHPNAAVGYVARCCTNRGREYLGFYPTPELAFVAYKKRKEAYAKELAEKWKNELDPRAYEALMCYTVGITD